MSEALNNSRPKRQSRKLAISDDFLDNIDDIEVMEVVPAPVVKPLPGALDGGPRKRGRPRKYPVAAPIPVESQQMKRPRGRPKGSGKHQRAAMAASFHGSSGIIMPTDSVITSGVVSAAPSVDLASAPPTASIEHDKLARNTDTPTLTVGETPLFPPNGFHSTPHYPNHHYDHNLHHHHTNGSEYTGVATTPHPTLPMNGISAGNGDALSSGSESAPVSANHSAKTHPPYMLHTSDTLKIEPVVGDNTQWAASSKRGQRAADRAAAAQRAAQEALDAPTPRPRNRRKGAAPTKTE